MISNLGKVLFIGAGNIENLTLGALKALKTVDTVLYDALIDNEILTLVPKHAKKFYVGKRSGKHSIDQPGINKLMTLLAQRGEVVARLKGGDPMIYSRIGEELQSLTAQEIPFRIIPGVSSMSDIAAYSAIPLSYRNGNNEFRTIQGHHLSDKASYWQDLARYEGLITVFMGSGNAMEIAKRLLLYGMTAKTPILFIESDKNSKKVFQKGILADLASQNISRKTSGPGLIFIGKNVEFWAECRHLNLNFDYSSIKYRENPLPKNQNSQANIFLASR